MTGIHRWSLQWRYNGRNGISNHQPHDCLLNRWFRRRSKKTPKLRVTGLCAGNTPENVSNWWRHHVVDFHWTVLRYGKRFCHLVNMDCKISKTIVLLKSHISCKIHSHVIWSGCLQVHRFWYEGYLDWISNYIHANLRVLLHTYGIEMRNSSGSYDVGMELHSYVYHNTINT